MNIPFLPTRIDNDYPGHKLALLFFWIVVIVRALQGISLIVGGESIVRDADGIPLETFQAAASQSIVAVFVVTGISRLILSLTAILIFFRYRSAIPLILAVLTLDQLGKEIILQVHPLFRVGQPVGPTVNVVLLVFTVIGLVLSMMPRKTP